MLLPKVVDVNTRATKLDVGGRVLKVVKSMTPRTWDGAANRMTNRAVWSCEELGVNRVSRLDMEWHLLVACGNVLERYEHQRSLEEWSLKILPRKR